MSTKDNELVYLPLGGTGEIGMNCNLYGYGRGDNKRWLMVDLGVMFAHTEPGIDRIIPDLEFIEARSSCLLGLFLTHGHEDHIGAVGVAWPRLKCPIYATPFTAALLQSKFRDAGLSDVPLHIVAPGGRVELDCFTVDYVSLTHSIVESYALSIACGGYRIVHSGDWKIDSFPLVGSGVDESHLRSLGELGVDALICDSTNACEDGRAGSEATVAENLISVIGAAHGRVVVTSFASNVARLYAFGVAADACGRKICLMGRGMERVYAAARSCGYLEDFPPLVDMSEAMSLPREQILIACTGSQGEDNAVLARAVAGRHPHLSLSSGDSVIFSSRVIPGNERAIMTLQNRLIDLGVSIVTASDATIHVSGHPCRDDLRDLYDWLRPHVAVPTHGESRHLLAHEQLARALQVPEPHRIRNGTMLRLAPRPSRIIAEVPHGRVMLDGHISIEKDEPALDERRKIGNNGLIVIRITAKSHETSRGTPEIMFFGIVNYDLDGNNIWNKLRNIILETLRSPRTATEKAGKEKYQKTKVKIKRQCAQILGKAPEVKIYAIFS